METLASRLSPIPSLRSVSLRHSGRQGRVGQNKPTLNTEEPQHSWVQCNLLRTLGVLWT